MLCLVFEHLHGPTKATEVGDIIIRIVLQKIGGLVNYKNNFLAEPKTVIIRHHVFGIQSYPDP